MGYLGYIWYLGGSNGILGVFVVSIFRFGDI